MKSVKTSNTSSTRKKKSSVASSGKTSNTSSTRKKRSSVASSGKTVLETEKKFFKMRGRKQVNDDKKPAVKNAAKTTSKVTSRQKNIKAAKRKLNTSDKPVTLRQMSLRDSFAAQTVAKRLRPRKSTKNYLEESSLIEKYLSPQRRNSIVVVEKMEPPVARKAPVYKSMRVTDEHVKNGDEIYDFKFDINDSTERRHIKKKKRVIRKPAVKRAKKTVASNTAGKTSKVTTNVNTEQQIASVPEVMSNANVNELDKDINSPLENNVENVKPTDILESEQEPVAVHNAKPQKVKVPLKTTLTDNASNVIEKPKVLSVKKLEGNNKILVRNVQENPKATDKEQFRPFRSTNAFRSMYPVQKEMVNHSLLNKSLSPINKSLIDFDPSSPWRPPTLNTFSQVKQVFQSTPQLKKQSGVFAQRAVNPMKKTTTQRTKINEITKNDENLNLNTEKSALSKQNPLKENSPSKSPRVFGTDITSKITMANVLGVSNKNSNAQSRSNVSLDPNKNAEVQSPAARVSNSFSPKLSSVNNIPDFDDYTEDKENTVPNFQSPKKSPKKLSKRLNFASPKRSLQQTQEIKATPGPSGLQKDNLEPQPGPSGLQRRRLFDEPKNLQQSKLNNFLNLDTMPESTRISTAHGIFDDAQSTPINAKPKKVHKEPDIKNAFGFEDSDSDLETSIANKENDLPPIKQPVSNESIRKVDDLQRHKIKSISKPSRISLGEMKKEFNPNVLKEKQNIMDAQKGESKITNYLKKSELQDRETAKNKQSFDVVSFSDTFDMMSENEYQTDKEQTTDPPLFADLEPSHFVQPPRYSYKRKRAAKYNFSDDEETENLDESFEKKQVKKKKVQKMNKKEEERLQEWVKNVNETFEEIDHYDLVVE